MSEKNFLQIFENMGCYESVEDDETIVYCYEPETGREYLIMSDETGGTPKEDEPLMIACYTPQNAFAWKVELNSASELDKLFTESAGGLAFIARLKQLADE